MPCNFLRVQVNLGLADYLAGLLELVKLDLIRASAGSPMRISGPYFRKVAPQLLVALPPGFVIEEEEVIYPLRGWARGQAPSQIVIDSRTVGEYSDLALGTEQGETVCWQRQGGQQQARFMALVERAGLLAQALRKARARGFVPLDLDIKKGTARLSGPSGILGLRARPGGQVEIWGEQFNPYAELHEALHGVAQGGTVLEHRTRESAAHTHGAHKR